MVNAGASANSTILEAAGPDAGTRKNAGISTADDSWRQVLAEKEFALLIPGGSAEAEALDLFSVELDAAGEVLLEEASNWIGPEDRKDLRSLQVETSGRYHFTLPALESNAKLTICKLENDKLKTVKRISVNPNTKEEKRGIFNLLLDAGTCLISFESKSWKNGRNTGYAATLSGTAFGKADRSDDQWQNAVALESPGTTDDWIGFSDLQDWKRFTVDSDTLCSLGLSEVTGSGTTPPSLSAEHQGRRGENPVENSFRKSKRRNHRTGGNPFRRNLLSCCQSGRKHQKSGTDCKLNLEFSEPDAQGMPA